MVKPGQLVCPLGMGQPLELEGGDGGRWALLPRSTLFRALSDPGRLLSVPIPPSFPQIGPAGRLQSLLLQLGRRTPDLDESPQVETVPLVRYDGAP